jgi:hypothetical protein
MAKEFVLRDEIVVHAPIGRCFLLSTSIEIVELELGMHPIRGRTSGLVMGGDTVFWRGWKFGLPQFHVSLIDRFEPPVFFRDRMIHGRFASFSHDHHFVQQSDGDVRLSDELRLTMPWEILGSIVGKIVLAPDIRDLLHRRFALLKQIAESNEWKKYLPDSNDST